MNKTIYKEWTLIPWDGNTELGYECYRKSIGNGHVSIGKGEFMNIVHSFGANSDRSYGSTRWRENGAISEIEAMELIDKQYGV